MRADGNRSFCKLRDRRLLANTDLNEPMFIAGGELPEEVKKLNASMVEQSEFRIRSGAPKVAVAKHKPRNIFEQFDEFVRGMIEREVDIDSETELYLRLLGDYLDKDVKEVRHAKKVEFVADTTNQTLQSFGEALQELVELKLNDSVIASIKDIGTSFKSLKVLWISRVGLKELAGIAMFPSLEELYASYNFVSDISDIEFLESLHVLDLEANNVADLMQLTYVPPNLRTVTLVDNPVAEHPDYMQTLLQYGAFLRNVDNEEVKKDLAGTCSVTTLSTPAKSQVKIDLGLVDGEVFERFKSLGLNDEIILDSIKKANNCLKDEPQEEEILRQSIKRYNKKEYSTAHTEPQLKYIPNIRRMPTAGQRRRIDRVQRVPPLEAHSVIYDKVDGYSELVSNTETTFAGNPVKVARRKRTMSKERMGASSIYELIDTFKDSAEGPKAGSKLRSYQGAVPLRNQSHNQKGASGAAQKQMVPELRKPVKSRRGLSIVRMRNIKK
eukprot:TRINITY_DN2891_c0_g6_i1.p1 TRINITY_DN2891_c0_g6~~TRINITY_DN2891_c0_g6_i1.p1  ORF type:complete len:497 (-),score=128.84 TRINITY_DN2891_c0_g6_i1:95-1585(-)